MRFRLGQRIIDKIRGKNNVIKALNSQNAIKSLNTQILDFLHFEFEQSLIFRKMFFDLDKVPKAVGVLRELQEVNFYILKRLKTICDKLNIKFWLHGGTLLGAVRNGGFIPWDDDIDIGIMRKDLDILSEYLKYDDEFELKYFYFIPGICSRQPRIVYKKGKYNPFFIDILIYDEIQTDNINEVWENFCEKKFQEVREIEKTKIYNNKSFQIDIERDKKIIDEIFDKYNSTIEKREGNAVLFNLDEGTNLISNDNNAFVRCFYKDFLFPLVTLKYNNEYFYVPKNYQEYLILQYGDYMKLPRVLEYTQHLISHNKQCLLEIHKTYKEKISSQNTIGYTAGAFDLFHIGHLNLLKNAKENCNYLIAGVTTDELIEQTKGHKPVIPLSERIEIVKACKYVDEVVIQDDLDKVKAWEKYHYNILFSGDDWKDNPRWQSYEKELSSISLGGGKVQVKYFPYTRTTSSTAINNFLQKNTEKVH